MKHPFSEKQVTAIAQECRKFEHIINAMGYGYSLLNVSPEHYKRRCPDCIHWFNGTCDIFQSELSKEPSSPYRSEK